MNQIQPKREVYDFMKHSLEKSRAQDNTLEKLLNHMQTIENNVVSVRDEVIDHKKEVVDSLNEMRNRVTIDYEEQKTLKSIVSKKAYEVAKDHYEDTDEYGAEIRELVGYAMRYQWKRFKEHFSITRYTSLRQVDYEAGKQYLQTMVLGPEFIGSFHRWKMERAKKTEREKNIVG